ncbi:MAG: ATPase, partial [Oscillibacter sp.]|nr:ATPase [Oscillibacter sp.]
TLAPSMLQFLQYKVFGTHRIPQGWIVVTAGNPPEYNKSVREYDIVTWDRLKRVDVEPDYETWKEYAYKKGIHGAILTFLEIKKNYFYIVETTVDRKSFVTARGWEDLSEMMKLYERHGLTVDQKLTAQYLQNPAVAREFAVYYDLYNKYRSDYQIEDILNGKASSSIQNRARSARFDERLSLLGLLIDAMNAEMRRVVETDNAILENLRVLKQIKAELSREDAPYVTVLHKYLDEERKVLRLGEKANSIDYEMRYSYHYVIRFLEDILDALNRAGVSGNKEAFQRIKASYDASTAAHKTGNVKIKARLENLFRFVDEVFEDGQETLILVTELTVRYYCAKFISKFGCDAYFKHNQDLQFYQRKQELLTEIAALEEL